MAHHSTTGGGATRATHYRALWRWHLYAGLFVAPVLLILSITGALYLFDREIERWWNADVETVSPGPRLLSLAEQETAIKSAFPGATLQALRLPHEQDDATKWHLVLPHGEQRIAFLDPYTGTVKGTADPDFQPMTIIRDLHGELLLGDAGSYVVELTACWTLVMLVTGLFLWWPRRWKLKGVIVPRLNTKGRRFWRDIHAIPSAINAILVAFLILTGMPWSVFWGHQFARLGDVFPFIAPSPNFSSHRPLPQGSAPAIQRNDNHEMHNSETAKLPWVVQHSSAPQSSGPITINLSSVEPHLSALNQSVYGGGVKIIYPSRAEDVFRISYVPNKAEGQRTIYVDPATGRIISDVGWSQYSFVGKATEWGVATHVGRQYGIANQLAGLIVCLALIGSVCAGVLLWWRKRPTEEVLNAPEIKSGDRLPAPAIYLMAGLAILFPLVGASFAVVWIVDHGRSLVRGRP